MLIYLAFNSLTKSISKNASSCKSDESDDTIEQEGVISFSILNKY